MPADACSLAAACAPRRTWRRCSSSTPGTSIWRLERVRFTERQPVSLQTSFIPADLCPDLARHDLRAAAPHRRAARRVRRAARAAPSSTSSPRSPTATRAGALGAGAHAAVPDRAHHVHDRRGSRRVPARAAARRRVSLPDRACDERRSVTRMRGSGDARGAACRRLVDDRGAAAAIGFDYEGAAHVTAGASQRWTMRFVARGSRCRPVRASPSRIAGRATGGSRSRASRQASTISKRTPPRARAVRWWNARLHTWHPFDHVLLRRAADGLAEGESLALRYGEGRRLARLPRPDVHRGSRRRSACAGRSRPARRGSSSRGMWSSRRQRDRSKVVVTAPSRVVAGDAFDLHVRVEDGWGNPASLDAAVDSSHRRAARCRRLAAHDGAVGRVVATRRCILQASRHPPPGSPHARHARRCARPAIRSRCVASRTAQPLYWADLHAQSVIGCGARSIDAYYSPCPRFRGGRCRVAPGELLPRLQRGEWRETQAQHATAPRAAALRHVAWRRVVRRVGGRRRSQPVLPRGRRRELTPLQPRVRRRQVRRRDRPGARRGRVPPLSRRPTRWSRCTWADAPPTSPGTTPDLDRLLEVHSTHATSEWFLFDALRRGYRMGVIAGSDSVDGRPGNSHPGHLGVRNVRGGLTAILAAN